MKLLLSRSPNAYCGFTSSGTLMLPCKSTLQSYKNRVQQSVGIVKDNLSWMWNEAQRRKLTTCNFKGGLLLDEMSIQDNLQIVRYKNGWKLVGGIDMGPTVNSLDYVLCGQENVEDGHTYTSIHVCGLWRIQVACCTLCQQ